MEILLQPTYLYSNPTKVMANATAKRTDNMYKLGILFLLIIFIVIVVYFSKLPRAKKEPPPQISAKTEDKNGLKTGWIL